MSDKEDKKIKYDPELELRNLQKQLNEVKAENSRLKEVILDNDLEEELDFDCTSVQEIICVNGINHIAQLVEAHDYDKKDVESFEKFFNILRAIRGKTPAGNKKVKSGEVAELLKIYDGEK